MNRVARPRLATAVLPSGTRFVNYRLNGARSTCVVLLAGAFDAVFATTASGPMIGHRQLCGHLLEHIVITRTLREAADNLPIKGNWKEQTAEWGVESAPGDLRRMLNMMASVLDPIPALQPGTIEAEWSHIRLEGAHLPNSTGGAAVHELLYGRNPALRLPEQTDPVEWADGLTSLSQAWLRPEYCAVVVAGPHSADHAYPLAVEAFERFGDAQPAWNLEDEIFPPPPPSRTQHAYNGAQPVPTLYAIPASHLLAYRGAHAVLSHVAHYELQRLCDAAGIAYLRFVAPAAHHVCGAMWSEPNRVDEALALLRATFDQSLDMLLDPERLAAAKKAKAKALLQAYCSTPSRVAPSYSWVRGLYPAAEDPFVAHLRGVAIVRIEDVLRLRAALLDESQVTTVEYRRA